MYIPLNWLLEGPAWMQYRVLLDLCGKSPDNPRVTAAHKALLADSKVQALIAEVNDYPGSPVKNHKTAHLPYHKLNFLTDIGLRAADPGMDKIVSKIIAHQAPEGPFQSFSNIPRRFGGTGMDTWSWMLCDAPMLVYALVQLGLGTDPAVQDAISYLVPLVRDNGWPCAASPDMGKFRGPGPKDAPCPYANLVMLKVMALDEELRTSPAADAGVECLLTLWENSRQKGPFLFNMGTDFRKLKAPLIWYDLLHVLDTLTLFPRYKDHPRMQDMLAILLSKSNPKGQFTAESMWRAWKEWEFANKKAPSRWITFLAHRIFKRSGTG